MEQRQHLRIQIPLGVEISHPTIGTQQTTARDISQGGVFVCLANPEIKVGAKVRVKLLNLLDTDTQHTPSVDMEVKRTTDDGLGLAFINNTARHLWASVERLRDELQIGRDYFQVHQSLVLHHPEAGILVVQQDGKWLLPGHYLTVGQIVQNALHEYCKAHLGVHCNSSPEPILADSAADISVLEAATFRVVYAQEVESTHVEFSASSPYRDFKWTTRRRDLNEITFAAELHRDAADSVLTRLFHSNGES